MNITIVLIFIMAGLVIGCGTTPTSIPTPKPTEIGEAVIPSPTPIPVSSPTLIPTLEPIEVEEIVVLLPTPTTMAVMLLVDDSCIDCHTNRERLIATAEEIEDIEELSEGEG